MSVVVSHLELRPLWEAYRQGREEAVTTPDLGRTRVSVRLTPRGIVYPNKVCLSWEAVQEILRHEGVCYRVDGKGIRRLQVFSPVTGRVVALYPTGSAPTVTLSGVPMHRIKEVDPWQDTEAKIRAVRPRGRVLDTCTGLGYTALAAARRGAFVLTVELDPAVLALARENPWSEELFSSPRIWVIQADVAVLIQALPQGTFDVVVHDPPMFALAGELYSLTFYREVYRVLRPGGRLFHYVGSPEKKMARNVTRGVIERLRAAGFRVQNVPRAFGVLAHKRT